MKIGVIGDLHLTSHRPERRRDDYLGTILNKIQQALDIFRKEDVDWVVQVGDFFDAPTVSNRVKSCVIRLLRQYSDLRVLAIAGQHDITGHSLTTVPNSPLAVLEAAEVLCLLDHAGKHINSSTTIYGASFGEEVPPVDVGETSILVTHRMIGDRPLYPGQPLESPRMFLCSYPQYRLVLCGDYHYPFQDTYEGRTILNVGCLVRKNIKDVDMKLHPSVATIDLDSMKVTNHPLVVAEASDVFDLTRQEKPRKDEAALQRLVEDLRNSQVAQASWKSILVRVLAEQNVNPDVKQVLNEAMDEVTHV